MDTVGPGPPDPGGQAAQQGGQSSNPNGPFVKRVNQKQNPTAPPSSGIIQKQNLTDPTSSRIVQKQKLTTPAAGRSSGSPRKSQRGKQKASSAAKAQQPASTSGCEVQSLEATLPRSPRGTAKEVTPPSRQKKREKDVAASATLTGDALPEDKGAAPGSRHDDWDESRVSKRPQMGPPVENSSLTITIPSRPMRCLVWFDCYSDNIDAEEPLFGKLDEIPGVAVTVAVQDGRTGGPSVTLSMAVNKHDLSKPISEVKAEVSCYALVWEPYILTEKGFQVQTFDCASLEDNENALGEAPTEIEKVNKGDLERLVCIHLGETKFRVSSPYERQYWTRLRDSDLSAHGDIEVGTDCLNLLEQIEGSRIHFKFWFRDPCVFSEPERICASPSKQCVEERCRGSAASEEHKVPKPTIGQSHSPGETVSDDCLATTSGSPLASSPGLLRTSALSRVKKLEDQVEELEDKDTRRRHKIFELENEDMQKRRRIFELETEVDALKAEAMALAAQQQREAVVSEQKDEQISMLQTENGRLKKRLKLERGILMRQLEEYNEFVRSLRRMSRHLPGISVEDEASQSSDDWPVAISDPPVDEASESSHGWPTVLPDPPIGESHQEIAPPSDQGIEMEPLDEAEGCPDETGLPEDEASEAAYDYETAIGLNAFAEPLTSSPPETAVEDREQFNTDWAAECHNLKKMKRSAKSKRKQQKKPAERD